VVEKHCSNGSSSSSVCSFFRSSGSGLIGGSILLFVYWFFLIGISVHAKTALSQQKISVLAKKRDGKSRSSLCCLLCSANFLVDLSFFFFFLLLLLRVLLFL